MKKAALLVALLLILAMALPVSAQDGPPKPAAAPTKSGVTAYVVRMALDPAVAYDGSIPELPATKPGKGQKINPNSAHVTQYTKFLERSHDKALMDAGVSTEKKIYDYEYALNGFAAILTPEEAADVAKQPGVVSVQKAELRYPQTDSSPTFLGLNAPGGPWEKDFDGRGVVVGVLDSGIWPEHPSFADDGSFPAPPPPSAGLPCEFGNTAHNPADAPFTCNNKLIGAQAFLETYKAVIGLLPSEFDSARDDDGHGTHTTSTAAGNAGVAASVYGVPKGVISGVAPRAYVSTYRVCATGGCYNSDTVAALDQAVADGVDVINYSIGGGASLTGADDIAFLFAADAGVFVANSAGNSGPGASTVGGPGTVPWITTVGASTQSRFFEGSITLGNGAVYTGASITPGTGVLPLVDAAAAGSELCRVGELNPAVVTGKIVLCLRGVTGRAEKGYAVFLAGGAGMILYNANDVDNLFTDNHRVPTVHIDNTPGLAIKSYIEAGGNPTAQLTTGAVTTWPNAPTMTIFSSRGPNPVAPDIIKPDVTAPGLQILAGSSPMPSDPISLPGELFQAIAGTSMSSPHVAGVFALVKQAHPDWSAAAAKSALMTTAYQDVLDNDRANPADPFDFGAGHIRPGGQWSKGSLAEPGLVYDAGFLDYLGFLCDEGPEVFANPTRTCGNLASAGIPTTAENLNYPSIGVSEVPGAITVQRTVTSVAKESGAREYFASVEAPAGYTVTVEPASFKLRSGQSQTFQVHINNVSAPIGEWRFGSLTWTDKTGAYSVRSPIAAKAVLFLAPGEVSGSGASGSLTFPVKFGYTGSYTAAPHGLVPATATVDNVLQDPDQNFDPSDGFSDVHTFNLAGAAFFRIKIPPDATEANADLDVYVYNPSNQQVASSTLGGTDEQVDIFLPADGTWTVYVHGWAAPGGDSDYTMSSWAVPLASGGSLSVTSAPTSATMGAVGNITVSWSGLAAGSWNLGAVSHTGDGGLMGLTLVEVTVP